MGNGIKNVTGHSLDDAIHILENNDHDLDKRLTILEKNQELNKEWQNKMDLKIQKIDDGIGEIRQCVKPKMKELEIKFNDQTTTLLVSEENEFFEHWWNVGFDVSHVQLSSSGNKVALLWVGQDHLHLCSGTTFTKEENLLPLPITDGDFRLKLKFTQYQYDFYRDADCWQMDNDECLGLIYTQENSRPDVLYIHNNMGLHVLDRLLVFCHQPRHRVFLFVYYLTCLLLLFLL